MADDDGNINDKQLVSVAITWSRMYYVTADRKLCSRGESNSSAQATESQTSCRQCLQVSLYHVLATQLESLSYH